MRPSLSPAFRVLSLSRAGKLYLPQGNQISGHQSPRERPQGPRFLCPSVQNHRLGYPAIHFWEELGA